MNQDSHQHIWSQFETANAPQRVIFLGASNLSRSFPTAVAIARAAFGTPLSIHSAMGPGRAYGIDSGFMGKKFSNIFSCGIWESLRHENVNRTIAFVTDVGNDLAYEAPAEAVLEWVTTCVDRLQSHQAQVVLTALPITPLERLSQLRFRVLRGLLFPKCRLKLVDFLDRAKELNAGLRELAESRKIPVFTVLNAWYGFDPIHPQGRYLPQIWRELFALSDASLSFSHKPDYTLPLALFLRCLSAPKNHSEQLNESHSVKRVKLFDGTRITLH